MTGQARIPIVAIVGRPNVGKSTLFNRYAGHRRALVANTPGLTRDRIVEALEIEGRRILLVDTAGLDPDAREGLPAAVQAQAESAVAEADAILFVVDGKAGLLPEDEAIARTLRRTEKPLTLVVNKIDRPDLHSDRLLDFYGLGFERVSGVSAEHGAGAFDALEALVEALPPAAQADEEAGEGTRVALAGRPNVGKSSLLNRMLGEERVVVSDLPGTTRDAVDIAFEHEGQRLVLVDTAGLRRPGRRSGTGERVGALMAVRALERAEVALLVIDADEGLTDQDAHVARMSRDMGCASLILANKWDLVPRERRSQVLEQIEHGLRFMSDAPILSVSAKTGKAVAKLVPAVIEVARVAGHRVATAELNRWLADVVARHDPGMAQRGPRRRRQKLLYATQIGVHPPSFAIFCTDAEGVQPAYRRFLENQLRDSFGFAGTPIRLHMRNRRESDPQPS
jgi:GTP-binding protein